MGHRIESVVQPKITGPVAWSRPFLETHMSIEPGRPALERMVAALRALP
ncbi:MAG: hypothetical protein ACO1PB_06475 [Ramlibacter sp.]